MKIRRVEINNRRGAFEIETSRGTYSYPFAKLVIRPNADDRVESVSADEEAGAEAFTYRLESGAEDTVHVDAVLEYNQDPNYLNELLLHRLTLEARKALKETRVSKRELVRRLGTSASQLYRLLDPANSSKSVGQVLALLHLLDREVDIRVGPKRPRKQRETTPLPRGAKRRGPVGGPLRAPD